MLAFDWGDESFTLLADKAIYWPRRRAVILADPHFGKSDHFRQAGIPVPSGITRSNLARIDDLLDMTKAARLIILGDLFHTAAGVTDSMIGTLRAWRAGRRGLHVTVIAGNHDRHAGPPPEDLDMENIAQQLVDRRLILRHEPAVLDGYFVMAGHVHPAVRLSPCRKGGRGLRAPCFHFARDTAVLPAFGLFTGTHCIRPRPGDRIIAVGPHQLVDVTPDEPHPGASRFTRRVHLETRCRSSSTS